MKKIAVIDIGSNSVRLMFVADGKVLYKTLEITRLGEGLASSGRLSPVAIERSAQAVAVFSSKAKAEGAQAVYAFATAAVRSAQNGGEFVCRVAELCPVQVEVISGEEEAEIGILGALGTKDGGIIDIGGASTEIIVRKGGAITYKKSVDVGVVRLNDLCGRNTDGLSEYAKKAVEQFDGVTPTSMYAIGGTATSVASIALGLKEYDGKLVDGFVLTLETLEKVVRYLTETQPQAVAEQTCVPLKRAEVLLGGAIWLYTILEKLGLNSLSVSDADNLEGYAVKRGLL